MGNNVVKMLGGPCDGTQWSLAPGQVTVRAFDGEIAYVYELLDGALCFTDSYGAADFNFEEFEAAFRAYAERVAALTVTPPIGGAE